MTDASWFTSARFGIFVHWGISSLPRGELSWIRYHDEIADEEFQKYFDRFEPDLYEPEEWARAARAAGARYVTITAKHHDGFCLWDSDLTDFKATNTSAGRDLIKPFVNAARAERLKVGFYYSLLDWHHPEFPIDFLHPLRNMPNVQEANARRDMRAYVDYVAGQLAELLTRYGRIDQLWFDFAYASSEPFEAMGFEVSEAMRNTGKGSEEWQADRLLALVRDLQPGILVNERLGISGDFVTPETHQPLSSPEVDGKPAVWEMSMTMTNTWSYSVDDVQPRRADEIVRSLIDAVSNGGNQILNIGPTGRGEFDVPTLDRLATVGEWMRQHGRSIYDCAGSAFAPPKDARYTQKGRRLYLHLFAWPYGQVHLEGLANMVEYAQLLHDAAELKFRSFPSDTRSEGKQIRSHSDIAPPPTGVKPGTLTIELPKHRPDVLIPVVELFLREDTAQHLAGAVEGS